MSSLSIWCCQYRHKMLNEVVMGMQFRFFRQHLKAAPAFRISLPSTFTVPVCRLLKDTGMHYFCRLFLWTMWVLQRCDLEQPLVFRISCYKSVSQDILPTTTHVEIVALNWTFFSWCFHWVMSNLASQPLDWTGHQRNKQTAVSTSSIFKFMTWVPQNTCTAFLIVFEYIIFSTCRLTISE